MIDEYVSDGENAFIGELGKSLWTGFVDGTVASSPELRPRFVYNDEAEGEKILAYLERNIEQCDEFWIAAAFLTTSGLACLHGSFDGFARRERARGRLFVSDYLAFTQPEALRRIRQFPNIETRLLRGENYHGKGYIFRKDDKYYCLIGSTNLTQSALCTNRELNLHVTATGSSQLVTKLGAIYSDQFASARPITDELIAEYQTTYQQSQTRTRLEDAQAPVKAANFKPNLLQSEALENLKNLRRQGANKALIVSATGTGKTVLAAFDAKAFGAKRLLFVVHRRNIAAQAMESFAQIFGPGVSVGIYSGNRQEASQDFLFATIQTINKASHLRQFKSDEFDYIVIDESHRAGAQSYAKVLAHFKPKFLLGMTATPERTDGYDIFKLYDNKVGCEIRLARALREELLVPFHYFGISDLQLDGEVIDDKSSFNRLVSAQRVNHIITALDKYGCDSGDVRGLVFCSRIEEARHLSQQFNQRDYKTCWLAGSHLPQEREEALSRLEADDPAKKLDYIFTVDIFNEGIDIPRLNQIVMLRPTQSAIIFIQQLGRGLRRTVAKEYLTVIDFIGNYQNNYLIPVAIHGDSSYDKDTLRRLVSAGSTSLPGASTVDFDEITKERIYAAIDGGNLKTLRALRHDYKLLQLRLGRRPMMMDFHLLEARNPLQYVDKAGSLYHFALDQQPDEPLEQLSDKQGRLLKLLCKHVNTGVRALEGIILQELIEKGKLSISKLRRRHQDLCAEKLDAKTLQAALNCLNLGFHKDKHNGKFAPLATIHSYQVARVSDNQLIMRGQALEQALQRPVFSQYLLDSARYAQAFFEDKLAKSELVDGFIRYAKYGRKDVFRILNWKESPEPMLNVGGYKVSEDKSNCPIFVTYHKKEDIAATSRYEDAFLTPQLFSWMTRSNRTLKSAEVATIAAQPANKIRLPLFVKKSDDQGDSHYFLGKLQLLPNSASEQTMSDGRGKMVSVVNMRFALDQPVEPRLYKYLTSSQADQAA